MATQIVDVSTQCTKEMLEIYQAIHKILAAATAAKAAGLSGGALMAALAGAGLQPLVTAIDGISGVAGEAETTLPEFVQTQGVGGGLIGAEIVRLVRAAPTAA